MQRLEVLEGAEEFSLGVGDGAGRAGALLVHGFTGSPQGMRFLGEYLAERGVGAFGVRLPGHGTTWQDLDTRTSEEWAEAVEVALDDLRKTYTRVFLVGLSFGAALSLDLAARRPDDVAGVVALASFLHTPDPKRFLASLIRLVAPSMPGVGNDICDPESREICYARLPTTAALTMLRYLRRVRSQLPRVTAPLLVVHSRNDHTAHPSNARIAYDRVSSTDKELVWLERSYHVITLDLDRDEVFERTHGFIAERSPEEATTDGV